jgi:hypothetical protein
MFKITTLNRYLRQWGYDHGTLRRQPAAVRFQAEYSNDCWLFDLIDFATQVNEKVCYARSLHCEPMGDGLYGAR